MFQACNTPHVFLLWRVRARARASAIAGLFHSGLYFLLSMEHDIPENIYLKTTISEDIT